MNKTKAKEKIKKLVDRYEKLTEAEIKKYNEQQTKDHFIRPLFEALGWDFEEDVWSEIDVQRKRVDYAFLINGIPKFFIEAKPLKGNLDEEAYIKQAVNYSWNKGVTWAVLTDFESIKIFNAQSESKSLLDKLVFEIPYQQYITDFDRLWLLAKESFKQNDLDEYAVKYGKKLKKLTVDEKLYDDFKKAREILTLSLSRWNEKVDKETIEEGVQRILDRLVFIRVLEDRGLEPPILKEMIHRRDALGSNAQLFPLLSEKYHELDDIYNSNIFKKHACDDWKEYDDSLKKVIELLYGTHIYEYDFKEISADILGGVYESYLGYIAKNPIEIDKNGQSGKLLKVESKKELKQMSRKKRKEQGIYYTPKYIVDYIVANTIGKKLAEINTVNELNELKVLDPACGSGSFLVSALKTINNKYKDYNYRGDQMTKSMILLKNIYGVDLDSQAVELAKLNLLIEALDEKAKLPDLTGNIRVGNSLISGDEAELKEYFGQEWRDKKPFNWQEEFKEVFKQGGFDVIIGNPPYIKEFVNKDAFNGLHNSPYYQGKMDIWTIFACVAIDLLKEGGVLSFIAPNNWITNYGASIFRDKVLKEGELKNFVDFGDYKVFEEAGIQTMIFVFQKKKPNKKYNIDYFKVDKKDITENELIAKLFSKKEKIEIEPVKFIGKNIYFSTSKLDRILTKILNKKNFELMEKEVGQGIVAAPDKYFLENSIDLYNAKEKEFLKKYYTSSGRYQNGESRNYIFYISEKNFRNKKIENYPNIEKHFKQFEKPLREAKIKYGTPTKTYFFLHREREETFFNNGPKIVCGIRVQYPSFYFTDNEYFGSRALNFIKTTRIDLKYLTGIINSNLSYFWLKNKGKQLGDLLQIDKRPLLDIPICVGDKKIQKIIGLVNKIQLLNEEIKKISENSDKWHEVKKEIAKTNQEIDQNVYELYGLTAEEKRTVEESLKTEK